MVMRSGDGRICTTVRPDGIRGKRCLDKANFQQGRCSSYVLIPARNRIQQHGKCGRTTVQPPLTRDQLASQPAAVPGPSTPQPAAAWPVIWLCQHTPTSGHSCPPRPSCSAMGYTLLQVPGPSKPFTHRNVQVRRVLQPINVKTGANYPSRLRISSVIVTLLCGAQITV